MLPGVEVEARPGPIMKSESTGDGEPVVLVPGGLTGWISWRHHARRLAARYRVIRVQLLSVDFGFRGQRLPPDYSVDMEVRALRGALEGLGVSAAHLVGWSYGAEVALSHALSGPQRVLSLTLIEPPAAWVLRSRGLMLEELAEQGRPLESLGSGEVSEEQLAWFTHFAGFVPQDVDPRKLPQWPTWMEYRQSLRTGDAAFRHQDDMAKVRGFAKPVLLFKGTGSAAYLNRIIEVLGQEFPHAAVEELPGGHALHLANRQRFLALLEPFLERAPAGP
jgi:pimeloyl-ACP methyl ester carboxylesterase